MFLSGVGTTAAVPAYLRSFYSATLLCHLFLMIYGGLVLQGVADTAHAHEVLGKGIKAGIEALTNQKLVRTLNRAHQRRHSSVGSPVQMCWHMQALGLKCS